MAKNTQRSLKYLKVKIPFVLILTTIVLNGCGRTVDNEQYVPITYPDGKKSEAASYELNSY